MSSKPLSRQGQVRLPCKLKYMIENTCLPIINPENSRSACFRRPLCHFRTYPFTLVRSPAHFLHASPRDSALNRSLTRARIRALARSSARLPARLCAHSRAHPHAFPRAYARTRALTRSLARTPVCAPARSPAQNARAPARSGRSHNVAKPTSICLEPR